MTNFYEVEWSSRGRRRGELKSYVVTVLGLVGGARGGRHRASPIHRRRARAASFLIAVSRPNPHVSQIIEDPRVLCVLSMWCIDNQMVLTYV